MQHKDRKSKIQNYVWGIIKHPSHSMVWWGVFQHTVISSLPERFEYEKRNLLYLTLNDYFSYRASVLNFRRLKN